MALIEWNDSLSVKIAEIDQQHQKLISMINELNDAMSHGKGKDVMARILGNLINYTSTHFRTEEKYFDQFDYPDKANHKREHTTFVNKVTDFKDGFEKGSIGLTIQVMNFLSDWLQNHIRGTDQKYSAFFNKHGLK